MIYYLNTPEHFPDYHIVCIQTYTGGWRMYRCDRKEWLEGIHEF